MLPKFTVLKPTNLREASGYALNYGDQMRFFAGGTDLLVAMHDGKIIIPYLVSLENIPGLHSIDVLDDGSLHIGSMVTFNEIVSHPHVIRHYPHFVQAMSRIGSFQVRNLATIGGNICSAVPSADSAPVLLVSEASIQISNGKTERTLPLREFFLGPRKTALQPGELAIGFIIPPAAKNDGACFLKRGPRKAMTISMVCAASRIRLDNGVVSDCAIALGAVAATPSRAKNAEAVLLGSKLTPERIEQAARIAAESDCRPIDDVRASADYRRSMVQVLVKRSLREAAQLN